MPSAAALRSSARRPGTVSVPSRGTPTESGPALAMLALLGLRKGMCIEGEKEARRAQGAEEKGGEKEERRSKSVDAFNAF